MDRQRRRARLGDLDLEYLDTGGPGTAVLLLHGALMDDGLWHAVLDRLPGTLRCVVPVLPMGAHRVPTPDGTDVSPRGVADLVARLIDELGLRSPVVVGNDTGGAVAQLLVERHRSRVGALVLVSCDAFDNFPPGLPGRVMAAACAVPGGMRAAMATLRWPPARRLPMTFGWMSRRQIDRALFRGWLDAYAADAGVRHDLRRMMAGVDRDQLVEAADALTRFEGPALVAWAAEDRVMPVAHAHRLVELLPRARLELVPDSYTLVPLDQPAVLARLIAEFVERDVVAGDATSDADAALP